MASSYPIKLSTIIRLTVLGPLNREKITEVAVVPRHSLDEILRVAHIRSKLPPTLADASGDQGLLDSALLVREAELRLASECTLTPEAMRGLRLLSRCAQTALSDVRSKMTDAEQTDVRAAHEWLEAAR